MFETKVVQKIKKHVYVQKGGTLLVAQLVEALRYKPGGSGFDSPIVSLEFIIDIILPAAL